jgi:hypothetical protein
VIKAKSGENYFIQQSIKMGLAVGGASLEQVGESQGKSEISGLKMAVKGNCSK